MLRLLLSDNQKTNLGNIRNVQRILWFTWPKHNNPINLYRAAFYLPNFFMNIYIYLCVYYYIKNFKNIYLNSFWFIFDFEIFFSVSSMLIYGPIFTLYEYCGGGGVYEDKTLPGIRIFKSISGKASILRFFLSRDIGSRSALFNKPCYVPGIFLGFFLHSRKNTTCVSISLMF